MRKNLFLLAKVFMLFVLGCNNATQKQASSDAKYQPTNHAQSGPDTMKCLKSIQNHSVSSVIVYINNVPLANGGVYSQDGEYYLVSTGHGFKKNVSAVFSVVYGRDTLYVSGLSAGKGEAVIMNLSRKRRLFTGFSDFESRSSGVMIQEVFLKKPRKVYSICGETFDYIGYLFEADYPYGGVIVKMKSHKGQSGSIFTDDEGNLLVLGQQHIAKVEPGDESLINLGVKDNEVLSVLRPIGFDIKSDSISKRIKIVPW